MLRSKKGEKRQISSGSGATVAQQAAQHADAGQQRHASGIRRLNIAGQGDQHAGEQAGDIAAQNAGQQAALQPQVPAAW